MAKGRKSGCPVDVRDWKIEIQDKTQVSETWLVVHGVNSIERSLSSTTEDGSATTDIWEEPYITKRSVKLTLNADPIVDGTTGDPDPGQDMLDAYSENAGCDGDATVRITDPYGHRTVADYIVTDSSTSASDTDKSRSWDLSQVGEAEQLPYIHVVSVAMQKTAGTDITTLALETGDTPTALIVAFTPNTASNTRFRVNVSNRHMIAISAITETGFSVQGLSAGTCTVTVTTADGSKTATLTVTITDPD